MAQNNYTIEINAPAEKVFACLINDPSQWIEMMIKSEKLTDGEHRTGTKFKDTYKVPGNKTMELLGEITAYEPNKRLKVFMTSDGFDTTAEYKLREINGRTHIDFTSESKYKNFFARLMSPLVTRMAQKELVRDFARLKALAEK